MSTLAKLFIFGLFLSGQQAFACSCEEWGVSSEMYRENTAVYLAMPVSDSRPVARSSDVTTRFTVVRDYKRNSAKEIVVRTGADSSNCGSVFKKHEGIFLLFAHRDRKGNLSMSSCDVGDFESSLEYVKAFNKY